MRSILSMFAKSPFKPLVKHMDKVRSCVDQIQPLFSAQNAGKYDKVALISDKIIRLEHDADKIKDDAKCFCFVEILFQSAKRKDHGNQRKNAEENKRTRLNF